MTTMERPLADVAKAFLDMPYYDWPLVALKNFLERAEPVLRLLSADSSEAGRGDAGRTDYKALFEMHESALIELWSLLGANGQHDAVTKLRALSAPVGEPDPDVDAFIRLTHRQIVKSSCGSDIVERRSFERIEVSQSLAEKIVAALTHPPAPAVGAEEVARAKTMIDERLVDLAEAVAIYSKDTKLDAPWKVDRNNREIAWLKDLRSILTLIKAGEGQAKISYRAGAATDADLNPENHEQSK